MSKSVLIAAFKNINIKNVHAPLKPGLCDNTATEVNIDIDVEILQILLILSCYWYCSMTKWVIDIDIDIAKGCYPISLLILILQ